MRKHGEYTHACAPFFLDGLTGYISILVRVLVLPFSFLLVPQTVLGSTFPKVHRVAKDSGKTLKRRDMTYTVYKHLMRALIRARKEGLDCPADTKGLRWAKDKY